jgi:hypothetical protein
VIVAAGPRWPCSERPPAWRVTALRCQVPGISNERLGVTSPPERWDNRCGEPAKPRAPAQPWSAPPAGPASGSRPRRAARRGAALGNQLVSRAGQATDRWFDEPLPGDRRSWAVPSDMAPPRAST